MRIHRPSNYWRLQSCVVKALMVAFIWMCGWNMPHSVGESPEENVFGHHWIVVVEDRAFDTPNSDPTHRYKLKVYESVNNQRKLILDRELQDAGLSAAKSIIATVKSFKLPDLDMNGMIERSAIPPSETRLVVYQLTHNRRKTVWFAVEEAERLGVQKDVERLIGFANQFLAGIDGAPRISRPAPK